MTEQRVGRRKFLGMAGSAAVMSAVPRAAGRSGRVQKATPKIKVGVIGLNHYHIYSQVDAVLRGGGELVSVYAKEPDLAAAFAKRFPQATRAAHEKAILESREIQLVLSAAIPDERAPLGIRVMQHGKDYMADKPGITTLAAARRGAPRPGGDAPHLLDHVQRAVREPRDGQGRRSWSRPARSAASCRPSASARIA